MLPEICETHRATIATGRWSTPLLRHLLTCPGCRRYARGIQQMNHLARRSGLMPAPALSPLTQLSDRTPKGVGRRKFMIRTIVGTTAALAAAGVGIVAVPLLTPTMGSAAVRHAVSQANTWHFTGWRLVEGKRARWEVWGRRAPFFYREQIGDRILIADEAKETHLIPPGDHRPKGLALITPAQPQRQKLSLTQGATSFHSGLDDRFLGLLKMLPQRGATEQFQTPVSTISGRRQLDEQGILTTDKRTHLPIHYQIRRALHQEPKDINKVIDMRQLPIEKTWTQAELEAQYDTPLPNDVLTVTPPTSYATVDLTTPMRPSDAPAEGTTTANGITLHGNVLEQDKEGNLHLTYDAWFGTQKKTDDLPLQIWVTELRNNLDSKTGKLRIPLQDEQGNIYLSVQDPVGHVPMVEWYLVPLEPLTAGQPLPKQLSVMASLEASWYEYIPEASTGTTHSLVTTATKFTLPLPRKASPLDYDTRPVPYGIELGDGRHTLALSAAIARAGYYAMQSNAMTVNLPLEKNAVARFQYWRDRAYREMEQAPITERSRQIYRREFGQYEELMRGREQR